MTLPSMGAHCAADVHGAPSGAVPAKIRLARVACGRQAARQGLTARALRCANLREAVRRVGRIVVPRGGWPVEQVLDDGLPAGPRTPGSRRRRRSPSSTAAGSCTAPAHIPRRSDLATSQGWGCTRLPARCAQNRRDHRAGGDRMHRGYRSGRVRRSGRTKLDRSAGDTRARGQARPSAAPVPAVARGLAVGIGQKHRYRRRRSRSCCCPRRSRPRRRLRHSDRSRPWCRRSLPNPCRWSRPDRDSRPIRRRGRRRSRSRAFPCTTRTRSRSSSDTSDSCR